MRRVAIRVRTRKSEGPGWESVDCYTPLDITLMIDSLESHGVDPGRQFTARVDFGSRMLEVEQGPPE